MNMSSHRISITIATLAAALVLTLIPAARSDADTCQTGGAVEGGNANGYNAGYYDGLCGQYVWFGYGYNYNNYCANAKSCAAAAGIGTTATGTCAAGTVYNYYAGGYHSQCRTWEYSNGTYDLNGYCSLSNTYVSSGACTGC